MAASPTMARGAQKLEFSSDASVYTLTAESGSRPATKFANAFARGDTSWTARSWMDSGERSRTDSCSELAKCLTFRPAEFWDSGQLSDWGFLLFALRLSNLCAHCSKGISGCQRRGTRVSGSPRGGVHFGY